MLSKNCSFIDNGSAMVDFEFPEMRVAPTINISNALQTRTLLGSGDIGGTSVYTVPASRKNMFSILNTNSAIVNSQHYVIGTLNTGGIIELDAEIY
jgi:hypothetical protein